MSTQFSMLEIMNAALISQGFDEMVAENDGTDEWRLLSRNWATIVEAELEVGAYSFTKKQVDLNARVAGSFGYDDAYLVPDSALHVRRLWVEDEDGSRDMIEWVQDGQRVHVTAPDGVTIEYVEAADPSLWTANFSRGVQMKMEAVLLHFKEEHSAAAIAEDQAAFYFETAKTLSSKARAPMAPFKPSRFAAARFRRG